MKLVKPMGWRPNRCLKTCQVELAGGVDSLWKLPRGMNAGRGVKKLLQDVSAGGVAFYTGA